MLTAVGDYTTVWKSFTFGVKVLSVNNGQFFIDEKMIEESVQALCRHGGIGGRSSNKCCHACDGFEPD